MDVAQYDHADGRIYCRWQIGAPKDVMNGHGLVQPCRLQNLLLLGGARGDYELALVRPCRDYGIYVSPLRGARGDVMNAGLVL